MKRGIQRLLEPVVRDGVSRAPNTLSSSGATVAERSRILFQSDLKTSTQGSVVYWMSRDQRVHDNYALLYAYECALSHNQPLFVVFNLLESFSGNNTLRVFDFMVRGLAEVESELKKLHIPMHLLRGNPVETIPRFVKDNNVSLLVCDYSPLRMGRDWRAGVASAVDIDVHEVDAHNIVPVWHASPKLEYAARTLRPKINNQLHKWLVPIPALPKASWQAKPDPSTAIDWKSILVDVHRNCDSKVAPLKWIAPGEAAAQAGLRDFLDGGRFENFKEARNTPSVDGVSRLSPWLHFGHISAQRVALAATEKATSSTGGARKRFMASKDSFLEELIIRRELSDNYCHYNMDGYDRLDGLYPQFNQQCWAQVSLAEHRDDKRDHIYTLEQLEQSQSHEDLWNAAQTELRVHGKMHGFMRMYWAKKILEWTTSPEQALEWAIYLNDKYSLDGRDPNGYVGCAWAIAGLHDNGWKERPVFGKVRYMNYKGCQRKFNIPQYIAKVEGKPTNPFELAKKKTKKLKGNKKKETK